MPSKKPGEHSTSPERPANMDLGDWLRVLVSANTIPNEALPQTDEVYAEDGALIAIANDRWTPIEPAGTMP
jgi:hypothetical protein